MHIAGLWSCYHTSRYWWHSGWFFGQRTEVQQLLWFPGHSCSTRVFSPKSRKLQGLRSHIGSGVGWGRPECRYKLGSAGLQGFIERFQRYVEGCGRFDLGCERFHRYRRMDWLYWKVERYLEGLGRVPSRDWQLLEVFMEDLSRVLGLHSCMVPEGCIG